MVYILITHLHAEFPRCYEVIHIDEGGHRATHHTLQDNNGVLGESCSGFSGVFQVSQVAE